LAVVGSPPTINSVLPKGATGERTMSQQVNVNPTSEHAIYLRLFITNGGGW
jgi:hypothetical protein